MTWRLFMAPGRSYHTHFKIILNLKEAKILLKVTQAAIDQINKELTHMIPDIKDPYIRLQMGVG